MPQSRKRTHSLRPFVEHLSHLAANLPSRDEVAQAKAALNDIIAFLEHVRASLDQIPNRDAVGSIAQSIEVFDKLLDTAQENPALILALGLSPKSARRAAPKRTSDHDQLRGQELFDQLAALTIDQIRDRLVNDSSLRLSDLRALAGHLHVRYQAKSTREALAQILTTRIANARGYEALSSANQT